MINQRRKLLAVSASLAVLALSGSVSALRIGEVCNFNHLSNCSECETGEFQAIQGGDKHLCAPLSAT